MAGIVDRFGRMLSSAGDRLKQMGAAFEGPLSAQEPPRAGTGLVDVVPASNPTTSAPSLNVPGVPRWGSVPSNTNPRIEDALRTVEAYFGRVSYDAGPSWARFSSMPATDLTPEKIVGAQQEARSGYPLRWAEMVEQVLQRDSHLSGIGQQRVDDVIKGAWRLGRWVNDDVGACIRSYCEERLREVEELEDGMAWLLWGNAYSYNSDEVTWKPIRASFPGPKGEVIGPFDAIAPARLDAVHSKHFRFDLRTDEPLLWLGSDQVSLPWGKFLFYRGEGQHPITELRGYSWPCMWLSMLKSMALSGWAVRVDRFELPTPLLRYGNIAQYREHKQVFEDILANLGQGIGAMVPEDVKAEMFYAGAGGRAGDPHSAMVDVCEAAQSVRVLGATLTAKIGNVGSFAASTAHMEVKYAKEEADARRLWSALRAQLLAPMVIFNARALAAAITKAGYPCTPEQVCQRVPKGLHRVPREIDPVQRMSIYKDAVNELGMKVGMEATYDEFNLPQPIAAATDTLPGKPQQVSSGGKVVGSVEASTEGADAPQQPPGGGGGDDDAPPPSAPAGKAKGGGGEGGPKAAAPQAEPPPRRSDFQSLGEAIRVLDELGDLVEADQAELERAGHVPSREPDQRFDHADQPRDANGRFAAVAGAKATVPAPPPPRAVSPEKAAAREKAKGERQAAREAERAEKTKAREGRKAEREKLGQARQAAIAERQQARTEKRQAGLQALRELGAPVTPQGKIDAARVPGADGSFQVLTSADPENSYRGRSFTCHSAKAMASELLGVAAKGGTNEALITAQLGHTDVKDPVQWEGIAEKYGVKGGIETFSQALQVLASASAAAAHSHRPDWRTFDFETLRECPGLEALNPPDWLGEAEEHAEMHRRAAEAAYPDDPRPPAEGDAREPGADDEGEAYHPPEDPDEGIPFARRLR